MHDSIKSLYVHFPFCEVRCHYCDFYSLGKTKTKERDPENFLNSLLKEISLTRNRLAPELDTVFFGGGTPSMTAPEQMAKIIDALTLSSTPHSETEWTMEGNPSSFNLESLRAYRKLGINRISMGVQSFEDHHLQKLGRVHNENTALRALNDVFESGFTNVSIDLMCGIPGQTIQEVERALNTAIQFPITHLSCYLLTLAPHHPLYKELPHEDIQLEHLLLLDEFLRKHGFEHYEISNFCRPGFEARHNLNYWKGKSYLGLGPSAHSFDALRSERFKNASSLNKYTTLLAKDELPIDWSETLTPTQKEMEKWMLAVRLNEGFPREWLDNESRMGKVQKWLETGHIEPHPDSPTQKVRLTALGFSVSDQIIQGLA